MRKIHTEAQAWQLASASFKQDEYHDVHCWVFTPSSFFSLIRTLINIELFDFTVAQFYETTGCEFYVSLRALEPIESSSDRIHLQLESLPAFDSKLQEQPLSLKSLQQELEAAKHRLNQFQAEVEQLKLKLQKKQDLLKQLRHRLKQGKIRIQQIQDEIAAIHSSKFWKLKLRWTNLKKSIGLKV